MRLHRQVARYFVELLIPAFEGVTFAFRVCRSGSRFAVLYRLALEYSVVVIQEGHRIGVNSILRLHGEVRLHVTEVFVPAGEVVSFYCRNIRCGSCIAVLYLLRLQRLAVLIHESHGINIDGVLRLHGEVRLHVTEVLVPAGEVIALYCRCFRCRSGVPPRNLLVLQRLTVLVHKLYSIDIDGILRLHRQVTRHVTEVLVPAREGIALARRV